jgi:hypothetical protein
MNAHAARRRERANVVPPGRGAVHLDIDRLVLHGVAHADAPRLAAAMEGALAALAAQPAARFNPLEAASLASPRIVAGRTPEHTGRAVAGAVWSRVAAPGEQR